MGGNGVFWIYRGRDLSLAFVVDPTPLSSKYGIFLLQKRWYFFMITRIKLGPSAGCSRPRPPPIRKVDFADDIGRGGIWASLHDEAKFAAARVANQGRVLEDPQPEDDPGWTYRVDLCLDEIRLNEST